MAQTTELRQDLIEHYLVKFPGEAAALISDWSIDDIIALLEGLPFDLSKSLITYLPDDLIASVVSGLDEKSFVRLFSEIDVYHGAVMLSRLNESDQKKYIGLLPEKRSKEIIDLISYPHESAGFLMDTQVLPFRPQSTVEHALEKLRSLKDRRIHNLYVVNPEGHLVGKVPVQLLAISSPTETLDQIMEETASVLPMTPQEEVVNLLKDGKIISLPVVDVDQKLLGVIRYDSLLKAAQMDATEDVMTMFGAGREERALSKVSFAIKKRLPWLQINLATAFLAASVVGVFEDTIARITVLAVFLPVVAGQSGNTGSQALAVTIRGLALREFRINQWMKVARKEVAVGFINGVAVALTTSVIVYFWASSFGLAVVIGTSMVFSMVIAGFSGAVIPIILQTMGQDPAQSSSIVLTTVTDIVGFLSFLGLATALGSALGIV